MTVVSGKELNRGSKRQSGGKPECEEDDVTSFLDLRVLHSSSHSLPSANLSSSVFYDRFGFFFRQESDYVLQ